MNQPIDLITDGHLQLTPKAAAILARVIRKALADQRIRIEASAVECHVGRRS